MSEINRAGVNHHDIMVAPLQVAFDITNRCNLRCLHCYNSSGDNNIMEQELTDIEVMDFVRDISKNGLLNFCFCGGETLLKKDLIIACCEILQQNHVKNIALVTNGLLITELTAKELKEAGINRIQVSLDGSNSKSHDRLRNKQGAFDKAINAIKILNDVGLNPGIAFTPTSFNIGEVGEVHEIIRKFGLFNSEFRMQPLMLLGRANNNLREIQPSDVQYRELVRKINEINDMNLKPKIQWGDPVDHLIRFRHLPFAPIQTTIRANGDICVSPYIPFVVGNIKKHSFSEYWNAGFSKIWTYEISKDLAKFISSISEMSCFYDKIPPKWEGRDIYIDLIDSEKEIKDIRIEDLA